MTTIETIDTLKVGEPVSLGNIRRIELCQALASVVSIVDVPDNSQPPQLPNTKD